MTPSTKSEEICIAEVDRLTMMNLFDAIISGSQMTPEQEAYDAGSYFDCINEIRKMIRELPIQATPSNVSDEEIKEVSIDDAPVHYDSDQAFAWVNGFNYCREKFLRVTDTASFHYCQSEIEFRKRCSTQCDHCAEYYKPLEELASASPSVTTAVTDEPKMIPARKYKDGDTVVFDTYSTPNDKCKGEIVSAEYKPEINGHYYTIKPLEEIGFDEVFRMEKEINR